jgi:hypothetical protein
MRTGFTGPSRACVGLQTTPSQEGTALSASGVSSLMQDITPAALFAVSCLAFLKFCSLTNAHRKDLADTANNHVPQVEVAPFPWEPRTVASVEKTRFKTLDKHISRKETEQLQFLASMTFAGGGLRQPNCPCCQ